MLRTLHHFDFFSTSSVDAVFVRVTVRDMKAKDQDNLNFTTSVVLPKSLHAKVRKIARAEGRSFASQVRIFLMEAVTRKNTEEGAA
jgi:hypothetical protein